LPPPARAGASSNSFTANLRNRDTRRAYAQAVSELLAWCEDHRVPPITAVHSVHVAGYIEELTHARSAPAAKQRLSAIRHLFDWLRCRRRARALTSARERHDLQQEPT
jgi:site-specific recombinase XerD